MCVIEFILLVYLMNRSIKNLIITIRRFFLLLELYNIEVPSGFVSQQTTGDSLMHLEEALIQND